MFGITITINDSKAVTNAEGRVVIEQEVYIDEVASGSIADGKFMANDIIKSIRIGDKEISVTRQFHIIDFMLNARVGDTVYTTVERNGEAITIETVITEECITIVQ